MVQGLIGKKLGMTQVFTEEGVAVPATVLQVGPCVVVQKKTAEKDGYDSVQLGLVDPSRKVRVNQPEAGHFKKAGVPPTAKLKEFDFADSAEKPVGVGDQILLSDVFAVGEKVAVTGVSKGRGFQGVIKRHGFSGGRATHGSMFHRAPGSIGASAYPSRVMKGMRGAGRMGGKQVKVRGMKVISIDTENNLLLVKGSVPGSPGGYVLVNRAN